MVVVADVSVAAAVAVAVAARAALQEAAATCRPPNTLRRRALPPESSAATNRAAKVRIAARNLAVLSLADYENRRPENPRHGEFFSRRAQF